MKQDVPQADAGSSGGLRDKDNACDTRSLKFAAKETMSEAGNARGDDYRCAELVICSKAPRALDVGTSRRQ
jgi:hypothetical protein